MINQICIAGLVQGLAEGIHFGKRAGLDIEAVLDVISKGAAGSWQMENRGKTMNQGKFDFGFAVDWMRKDLGICLDEARKNGAQLPVTALVDQFYAESRRWAAAAGIPRASSPGSKDRGSPGGPSRRGAHPRIKAARPEAGRADRSAARISAVHPVADAAELRPVSARQQPAVRRV